MRTIIINYRNIPIWLALVISMTLFGCRHGQKIEQQEELEVDSETINREGIYKLPGDYEMDYPKDLLAYFDSLCQEGAYVATHTDNPNDSLMVWDAIRCLNRFSKGMDKVYPATQIRKALEILRLEQAYYFNHSGSNEKNGGEAFMFRLIEQAALHCNQIDYITDFCADDRKVGVLYFGEWGLGNPLYSILVYQVNQGFRVKMIGDVGDAKIEEVFRLADKQGREYYLCSNNNDGVYFRQYLYGWDKDDLHLICKMDAEFCCPNSYEKGYKLIFNSTDYTWSYCKKDGNLFHRVNGTPMLRLLLEREASEFVVE